MRNSRRAAVLRPCSRPIRSGTWYCSPLRCAQRSSIEKWRVQMLCTRPPSSAHWGHRVPSANALPQMASATVVFADLDRGLPCAGQMQRHELGCSGR